MINIVQLLHGGLADANAYFNKDPRIAHFPLLGPPWSATAMVILYLLFVKKFGPKFMENRKAYSLKGAMQAYNVMQVLLNAYVFIWGASNSYFHRDFSWTCQKYDIQDTSPHIMALRWASYGYYISKYCDLLDTVFFVLRKKNNQITFLHVYHHALMVLSAWTYNTLLLGSHLTMIGIINAFVHVVMYGYYFVSTLETNIDFTSWKRYITQIQIFQFLYLVLHFAHVIFNNWCNLETFWVWFAVVQNFIMLTLFTDFYIKSYIMKPSKKKETTTAVSSYESQKEMMKNK